MEKIRVKECVMCGKVFAISGRGNRCYCGDKCRREKILQTSREYYRAVAQPETGKDYTAPVQGLAELNRRARAAGMSYGKYQIELQSGRHVEHEEPEGARGGEV